MGNRTSQTAGGATTNYTFDSAVHLTAVNGNTVSSDANGNVTQDDTGGLYTWDVRGRLIGLTKGTNSYAFQYDPDNLRTSKSVNGVLTAYLLDGDQVVTDTINGTAYQNLFGPGTDHALARNGEFFLPNHLSSTTGLTNGSGTLTQSYLYGPFGESLNTPSDSNPFQFTGRENDGGGLLYYRARYYNPSWGRFLSADPLSVGAAADAAGGHSALGPRGSAGAHQSVGGRALNPYAYAGDNPMNALDPWGTNAFFDWARDWKKLVRTIWTLATEEPIKDPIDVFPPVPPTTVVQPAGPGSSPPPPGGGGPEPPSGATPSQPTGPLTPGPATPSETPTPTPAPEGPGSTFTTEPESGGMFGIIPALFDPIFKALTQPHYNPWTDPANYPFGVPSVPPVVGSKPEGSHRRLAVIRTTEHFGQLAAAG